VEVDAVLAAQFTAGSEIGVLYDLDDVSDLVVDPRVTQQGSVKVVGERS
jgi:hypothetical protein